MREQLGSHRVSERRACRVLGQPRSTQRRKPYVPHDEPKLVADMIRLGTQYGRYGYPRIIKLLRREGCGGVTSRVELILTRFRGDFPANREIIREFNLFFTRFHYVYIGIPCAYRVIRCFWPFGGEN